MIAGVSQYLFKNFLWSNYNVVLVGKLYFLHYLKLTAKTEISPHILIKTIKREIAYFSRMTLNSVSIIK